MKCDLKTKFEISKQLVKSYFYVIPRSWLECTDSIKAGFHLGIFGLDPVLPKMDYVYIHVSKCVLKEFL